MSTEQEQDIQHQIAEMRASLGRVEVQLKKVHRYLFWASFFGWVKLLLIVVPLILGIWYLAPYYSSIQKSLSTLSETIQALQSNKDTSGEPSIFDDPRLKAFLDGQYPAPSRQ